MPIEEFLGLTLLEVFGHMEKYHTKSKKNVSIVTRHTKAVTIWMVIHKVSIQKFSTKLKKLMWLQIAVNANINAS